MAESGDPILSADVSIETHNAHQALMMIGAQSERASGGLDKLAVSVAKVETSAKSMSQAVEVAGQSAGETSRDIYELAEATDKSAQASQKSVSSIHEMTAAWLAAEEELRRNVKVIGETSGGLRRIDADARGAVDSTMNLGRTALSMVGAWAGLQGVSELLSRLTENLNKAAEAARDAGKSAIQRQVTAQDVAINLNLQGPAGLQQAQKMIAGVMQRGKVTEEQAVATIAAVNDSGYQPLSAPGGKVIDLLAQFSARNKVSGDAERQLAKVMSDMGAKTPEGVDQFLARLETGFRTTPSRSMDRFLSGMFRGVSEPVAAQGGDFWQTFSQYIGAVRSTGTEHAAATAVQQTFNAAQGTSAPAQKFLARAARLQGITSVDLPSTDELRQHALTRETPEDEGVIAASDRMERLKERADAERERYDKRREEILKPFKGRKLTLDKIRAHDTKVDRDLTMLDNERERQTGDFEREWAKAKDDEADARKKLAEAVTSKREIRAFMAAGPESRMRVFRSFLATEQGRQQLREQVGTDEQARMAMTLLRPENQAAVAQTHAEVMATTPAQTQQSQAMYEKTLPAQQAAAAASIYADQSTRETPGMAMFKILSDRAKAEYGLESAEGKMTRGVNSFKTEAQLTSDIAVDLFYRQVVADMQSMTPEERAAHPEVQRAYERIRELRFPTNKIAELKGLSAGWQDNRLRSIVTAYGEAKDKRDKNRGGLAPAGAGVTPGVDHLPAAPTEAQIKQEPIRVGAPNVGSSHGDFGLPDVSSVPVGAATTTGSRTSGSPRVVNNVTIGTVISRGGDALDFPAPLDRNAHH